MAKDYQTKSTFDYLYILFVHDSIKDSPLENYISLIENTEYSDNIKVIIIFNKIEMLGTLPDMVSNSLKISVGYVVEYTARIYESFKQNDKLILKEIQKTSSWKEAFDFVLSNYQYKKIILQTLSHSNGVAINANDNTFLASNNNIIKGAFFKQKVTQKTNNWKKNAIIKKKQSFLVLHKKFIKENKGTPFLVCRKKKPDQGSKKKSFFTRFVNPGNFNQLRPFDRLFIFELSNYLDKKKVIAEVFLLNNCYVATLDNFFNLKNVAKYIVAPSCLVPHLFFNPQKIIQTIMKKGFEVEQVISYVEEASKDIIDKDPDYKLKLKISVVESKHINKLVLKFDEIITKAIEEVKKAKLQNNKELLNKIYSDFHHLEGTKEPPKHEATTKDPDISFYDITSLLHTLKNFIPKTFSSENEIELNNIIKSTVKYHFSTCEEKTESGISVYIPSREAFFFKRSYYYNYYYSLNNYFVYHSCYTGFIKLISSS